ncbi:MAG: glycosyltransferase family 4 protein [Bdellovibrionota bacterium]
MKKDRKKICISTVHYPPYTGGVGKYSQSIASELTKMGHHITVVTTNCDNYSLDEKDKDISFYRLKSLMLIHGRFPIPYPCAKSFLLIKQIKDARFDSMVINCRFYLQSLLMAYLAYKNNIKCLVIEHGSAHLTFNNRLLDLATNLYEHCITSLLKRYCKNFCAVSAGGKRWLNHFAITGQGVLPNCVDSHAIEDILTKRKRNFRDEFHLPKEAIVISFIGRLFKFKGILQLLAAFQKLSEENKNIFLFIAGDGVLYPTIKAKANKNIIVLGSLSFEECIILQHQTDIFCLPSDSEGFASVLLEAAICESYVVCTKACNVEDLILDDTYGIVLNDNTQESIYAGLKKAINNKNKITAIKKLKELVLQKFTWERTAKKLLQNL